MKGHKGMVKKYKEALGFALLVVYAIIVFGVIACNYGNGCN